MKEIISHLFFPSVCPHCDTKKPTSQLLCTLCSEDLHLAEEAKQEPSLLDGLSYALPYEGANVTLHHLLRKNHFYLAKPLAAILHVKLLLLSWSFDTIISYPSSRFSASYLLAEELKRIYKLPNSSDRVLIVSTLLNVRELQQTALKLSPKLPKSIYAISLWGTKNL